MFFPSTFLLKIHQIDSVTAQLSSFPQFSNSFLSHYFPKARLSILHLAFPRSISLGCKSVETVVACAPGTSAPFHSLFPLTYKHPFSPLLRSPDSISPCASAALSPIGFLTSPTLL